jgi:DNA polymerase-4
MKRETPQVAHVTLDNFFDEQQVGGDLEALLSRTSGFEHCLARHGTGWQHPSADEAFLVHRGTTADSALGAPEALDGEWAERLREDIRNSIAMDSSVGIASTRLAARIASRLARPRGLLILLPGYEARFIASVPLAELDELRPAQAAALHRRGIETLGELAQLTGEEARTLLGPGASGLLDLVRGMEIGNAPERATRLERGVSLLCRRAARRLGALRCAARGMELELVYHDGVSLKRYSLAPHPIATRIELEISARKLLGSFSTRAAPLVGLSLTLTALVTRPEQLPLFSRSPVRDVSVRLGRHWDTGPRSHGGDAHQAGRQDSPKDSLFLF